MSITWDEIVNTIVVRQRDDDAIKRRMIDVKNRYNGGVDGWVLPLDNELEQEQLDPLIPALVAEAVDQLSMRAGSTIPGIACPAIQPGKESGVRSRQYANIREKAILECYERSRFGLGMRRMYRHLYGYASMAAAVMPDPALGMPRIKVMDPLSAYPEPQAPEDLANPRNCAFIFGKSADWLMHHYPASSKANGGPVSTPTSNHEQMWDVAFWVDDTEWVYGIVGPRRIHDSLYDDMRGENSIMELSRWEHGLDNAPFVVPHRVTMDKIISQITNVTGLVDIKARLMRLQLAATEKAVFPDKYVLGDETQAVVVNDGTNKWKDGRTGEVNVVLGAKAIGNLTASPDQSGIQLADRFERDFRISTGLVPQTGGETYGALRTGRGIDTLMSEAVDPRVQEAQEVMESYLPHLNTVILEMFEKQYGAKKFFLFPGYAGDTDAVEFTPNVHVESNYANRARYSITGAGVEATNIIVQQMVASELISRETAREMHPYIRGNNENARITTEKLEQAVLQGILQGVLTGQMPPIMAAFIEEEQSTDPSIDIFEALRRANKKMQELQAEQAQQQTDPALQPGIQQGAPAGPQPPPQTQLDPQIAPTEGLGGLRELNNALAASDRNVGAA